MAYARKGWDSLSPTYRNRLKRGGINRRAYESGARLSEARGHAPPFRGRAIKALTTRGEVALTDTSAGGRSLVGTHWNHVKQSVLNDRQNVSGGRLYGRQVRQNGSLGPYQVWRLETDIGEIRDWFYEAEPHFEDIYEDH